MYFNRFQRKKDIKHKLKMVIGSNERVMWLSALSVKD